MKRTRKLLSYVTDGSVPDKEDILRVMKLADEVATCIVDKSARMQWRRDFRKSYLNLQLANVASSVSFATRQRKNCLSLIEAIEAAEVSSGQHTQRRESQEHRAL